VDEGVVIKAGRRRTLYHDRDIFTARLEPIKKSAQPWRVLGGLSALAHEPAQQQTRRKNPNRKPNLKKNPCELNNP
jgi:hypothetical protein